MPELDSKASRPLAWIRPLVAGAGPRYLQIVDLIADAIRQDKLAPGDQVPPQRSLAAALGVDLTTVTRAYTEARNRGLIESFGGRGSFVATPSNAAGAARIDLSMNVPPQPSGRSLGDFVRTGVDELFLRQSSERLSAYDTGGLNSSAIQAGRAWLGPALGDLAHGKLVMSAGTQAAIFAILLSVTRRGDTVLCEPLTYPGFLLAARKLDLRVVAVQTDDEGIMPDALESAQRSTGAGIVYLNPTLHNPTTRTMPAGRREDIAAMLRKLKMTLIEDDPYGFLLNDAPPPLATFTGGERTYYMASLSKCLWPSLRTAFVLMPEDGDGAAVQENLRASGMGGSPLLFGLSEQWIRTGMARQLLVEIQREARARQTLARSLLPKSASAHPSGLHIWLPLPPQWNSQLFVDTLEQRGIIVAGSDAFGTEPDLGNAVRISVGGAASQPQLRNALQQISHLLQEDRRRGARPIV
ncbi:PLP-dependent aminotransferase family protein [Cupriavidus sp. 30B13]|uniref:aminotransferase-like domain-containing protein n=1 Tax=Cupriavidus sp. 30B13 TaxID=3384241 RepID=UPI003B91D9D4